MVFDTAITEILIKLTDNQVKLRESIDKWNSIWGSMQANIDKINDTMNQNTEIVHGTGVILAGMKDLIKEFSLYASNRMELDKHLHENIVMLGEYWQKSIDLFTETKYLIEGIHAYSEEVATKRSRILSSLESKKFQGLNLHQEWLLDFWIDVITRFSYDEKTHEEVEKWVINYHREDLSNGFSNLPQYIGAENRSQKIKVFIDAAVKEFKLTVFVDLLLNTSMLMFQSTEDGIPFNKHPSLGGIKKDISALEGKFYE